MTKKTRLAFLASVVLLIIITGYLWQPGFLSCSVPLEKITPGAALQSQSQGGTFSDARCG